MINADLATERYAKDNTREGKEDAVGGEFLLVEQTVLNELPPMGFGL
jgi:hypothetical protein